MLNGNSVRCIRAKSPKHTSHGLHLFLTIITGGAWGLFVWIPITIWNKSTHEKSVTRVGYLPFG
jgi:hypothetical protein